MKKYLKKLWNGDVPLWQAFWLWFVLLLICFFTIETLLSTNTWFADLLFNARSRIAFYSIWFVWIVPEFILRIFQIIIVWKNASNCNRKLWEHAARILIGLFALSTIYGILDLIIYIYDFPNSINFRT